MSARGEWDVVVLGAGPAGQKAAIQAAKAGKRALVVEQESGVGGACVHRGTIPSKTLRETALALSAFRHKSGHVVDVAIPEDMQIASLLGRVDQVVAAHERFIDDQLRRNRVDVLHGRARFASPHEVEVTRVGGEVVRVRAPLFVIATGSRPRTPGDVPIDHDRILDSDSILSIRYLPVSLTVVGAGVIASEYASVFAALGTAVTMVDRGPRPLGFLDPELGDRFVSAFARAGGRYLGGRALASVDVDGVDVVSTLDDGSVVRAEKMLYALGRVANVDRLNLAAAGLTLTPRGLVSVDAHGRTAVSHIYAVGDVIGPPSLASAAMEQGRRAMCHAFGLPLGAAGDICPAGVFTIPEIATVGLTEADAVARFGGALVGRARFDELARGQIGRIDDGMLKLVADPEGRRVVGVQVIGEGAAELVHVGQMAICGGMNVDVFVDGIFNFPTLAEAYRVAALEIAAKRSAQGVRPSPRGEQLIAQSVSR